MFPYPIATPQGCNIQTFYGPGTSATTKTNFFTWNKPVGVSHVYMMLIGGGGTGDGATGGGSGAVIVWYGAAQHVPNNLQVAVGRNEDRAIVYMYSSAGRTTLLQANGGSGVTGGTATTAGSFAASGFYKSTAGQDGTSITQTPSSTTFLSAGATLDGSFANYGYNNFGDYQSYFLLRPIIVGVGASCGQVGSIGCGGGSGGGSGGPCMVLIASW